MAEQTYGDWIRSNPPLPTKEYKKEHMQQQTAVEWLVKEIAEKYNFRFATYYGQEIEKAKEMDKQQHGQTWDAAIKAHDNRGHVHARSIVDFDEYYEQQFKK
jgi:hypothetical protein